MGDSWDRRVERASQLAREQATAGRLLLFYADILAGQRTLSGRLYTSTPAGLSGNLSADVGAVAAAARPLVQAVASDGPPSLAAQARELLGSDARAIEAALLAYWRAPSDVQFFAKAILQPYAQGLAERGLHPSSRTVVDPAAARCPFCGGSPQAAVLEKPADGDGAARRLLCATCLTEWPVARLLCAHCGETDERQLGYFESPSFEYLRLDTCDTCRRYLKTVDRTRSALAVPLVDEVAGAALDVWARDHGYRKIQLNLVGL